MSSKPDPRPRHLALDLNEGGLGTVTLDGKPLGTSEVHISAVAGEPTRVQLVLPAISVEALLSNPEARYRVMAAIGLENGKPVIRRAVAWTLGAALRDLAAQADEHAAEAGI